MAGGDKDLFLYGLGKAMFQPLRLYPMLATSL